MSDTLQSPVESSAQRLILEQASAFALELLRIANEAPDGEVLKMAELFVMKHGREFLCFALTNALQTQADGVEKKGRRGVPVHADTSGTIKVGHRSSA